MNDQHTGDSMTNIILETTHGDIEIELNADKAPVTVENILAYVRDGFYDGTIFHRVIKGFMIQGGGFNQDMTQKATNPPFKNEADNGLTNDRGTIAMARTSDPNSATAQFFINHKDNGFLNYSAPTTQGWGYCVFGKVVNGMDVVDAIANVSTSNQGGHGDVPTEAVIINKAREA
jgi:peptidyl-prolyl cis-trans isomerase B (cyclophilin B)